MAEMHQHVRLRLKSGKNEATEISAYILLFTTLISTIFHLATERGQNIIYYEYLPALLGEDMEPYQGYKPDVHPGVSEIFQSAAFRFGHTTIPPGIYKRSKDCSYRKTKDGSPAMRLCATWWDTQVKIRAIK